MESKKLVQFYKSEDATCTGNNHTLIIGDEIHEVCACGNGCEGTFPVRQFIYDISGVVVELDELEEGFDYEEEEDEECED